MINKYTTKGIARRWAIYYMRKNIGIKEYSIRQHPDEFGFAIYVRVYDLGKLTYCIPLGS